MLLLSAQDCRNLIESVTVMSWVISDICSDATMFTSMKSFNYCGDKLILSSQYDKETDVRTLGEAGKWRFKFDQECGDEGGDVWRISSAKYNGFVYASDKKNKRMQVGRVDNRRH